MTPDANADADAQHRKNLCADPFEPDRIGDATESGRRGSRSLLIADAPPTRRLALGNLVGIT